MTGDLEPISAANAGRLRRLVALPRVTRYGLAWRPAGHGLVTTP